MVTDPRERLVQTGNSLLDVIYQEAALAEYRKKVIAMTKMADGDAKAEAAKALLDGDGTESFIKSLELEGQRRDLTNEYVTIRQTIEALIGAPAGDPR